MSKEWDKRDNGFKKGLGAGEGCPRSVVIQTRQPIHPSTGHTISANRGRAVSWRYIICTVLTVKYFKKVY